MSRTTCCFFTYTVCTTNFNKFRCLVISHHTGRHKVLQCLLDIHQLLNSSELYYILNNLYITDYCAWLQHSSPQTLHSLAQELSQVWHSMSLDHSQSVYSLATCDVCARWRLMVTGIQWKALICSCEMRSTSSSGHLSWLRHVHVGYPLKLGHIITRWT